MISALVVKMEQNFKTESKLMEKISTEEKKSSKPVIYTESDRIINELKEELNLIGNRVDNLETDRTEYREFLDQFYFQQSLSEELVEANNLARKTTSENFEALAEVMNKWKTPVSSVVENLENIVSEIDDEDTRETLRDCMNTAEKVLDSFNEAEEFCSQASQNGEFETGIIEPRKYFKQKISSLSNAEKGKVKNTFRLLFEKNVPKSMLINQKIIDNSIDELWQEIVRFLNPTNITFRVATKPGDKLFGFNTEEFVISLETEEPTELTWCGNIADMIKANQERLKENGLKWLAIRDKVLKVGGKIELLDQKGKISGYRISMPLVE